jgi:HEPN domain-containing protein
LRDDITLLQRAERDFTTASIIANNRGTDELLLDIIAYHIQQGIEKCLKFNIQLKGGEFPHTHEIKKLVSVLDNLGEAVPDWIIDSHEIITEYAIITRYNTAVVGTIRENKKFLELGLQYLESLKEYKDSCSLKDSDERKNAVPM